MSGPLVGQDATAGRDVGGFSLFRKIGSGGMASVYLAHRAGPRRSGQLAAVKVVHPHLAELPEYVEMFLDEARIAARIDHPNVCRVYDFGRSGQTYYLAMEYLTGQTWGALWKRACWAGGLGAGWSLPAATAWVLQRACEGVHAAHEAKDEDGRPMRVVHRDISPDNIFVTFDGGVRVLDFGIASAADRLHMTRTGTVKGHLAYMAPEQMTNAEPDRRADVWSLGVLLWEGLTGRRLFSRATEAQTMLAVAYDPIPPVPRDLPGLPRRLVAIAEKALQRDPDRRFASAHEMGRAIAKVLAKLGPRSAADVAEVMQREFADSLREQAQLRADVARHYGTRIAGGPRPVAPAAGVSASDLGVAPTVLASPMFDVAQEGRAAGAGSWAESASNTSTVRAKRLHRRLSWRGWLAAAVVAALALGAAPAARLWHEVAVPHLDPAAWLPHLRLPRPPSARELRREMEIKARRLARKVTAGAVSKARAAEAEASKKARQALRAAKGVKRPKARPRGPAGARKGRRSAPRGPARTGR